MRDLIDRLEQTTNALEVSIEPWSGAAKERAKKHVADNRKIIEQMRAQLIYDQEDAALQARVDAERFG